MMVIGSRTARLSPPVSFVWRTLTSPDRHPHNRGNPWPRSLDGEPQPRIVDSHEFDRVVWTSPWRAFPDLLLQFDLRPETILRWTLLAREPIPDQPSIELLRTQVSHLVNVDLRRAFAQVPGQAAYRVTKI